VITCCVRPPTSTAARSQFREFNDRSEATMPLGRAVIDQPAVERAALVAYA